jgi:precorrin-6Y C5,15-methyltransferase (decarboxylating)
VLARHLEPGEWRALPEASTFSLAAARMGWGLETVLCFGLHAAPLERLRPSLAPGVRAIVLLRDGAAVGELAAWLAGQGFGESRVTVMEALGGPRERVRSVSADGFALQGVDHPVCVALEVAGSGDVLTLASGRADEWFANDGQITKRPMRALTLSALAPRPGEHLWDIGSGSGSIAVEWLLSGATLRATAVEANAERAGRIGENAARFGLQDRLTVVNGAAPGALDGLDTPQAVFIGGGLSEALLAALWAAVPTGTRVVGNAVTLDSEALLASWQADKGGTLLRIELSEAGALGTKRGWKAAYPVVQWSVVT